MRIKLAAAVALAPMMIASGAAAQVVISNERTTPIATATANNGSPSDIQITNAGTIRVATGAAVTVNSSNSVTNAGRILMENADDGATGVLLLGGNTANFTNNGQINITDNVTNTDTDNDGDQDGAFASGTGRFGVRLIGPGDLTGNIVNSRSSIITVEGNQSAGISVETGLIGNLSNFGAINMTGDQSFGIRTTGQVTGNVWAGGPISARGAGSVGVSIEGGVTGSLTFGGAITATGFRYTGGLTQTQIDRLDADDLLIGGPAVSIASSVGGGVLFDIAHINDPSDTDDDDDGILDADDPDDDNNGIPDADEGNSTITSYGSGPAVQVGSMTQVVTLGTIGTGDMAYGLVNRGVILGDGVYDGVSATGLRLGLDGGQAVTLTGGLRNAGSISAFADEARATAIIVSGPTDVGRLINEGVIISLSTSQGDFDAFGLDIGAGATLSELNNSGVIQAIVRGETGDAYAIRDASGTLTSITNTGAINAAHSAEDDDPVTGRAVAIDVSANTTGVTVLQDVVGADLDDPTINGEILFGSGADLLDVRDGLVTGDVSFGAGADTLSITGGAQVRGAISDGDGLLQVNVTNGILDARQSGPTTISGLNIGADGDLIVTVDPGSATAGGFIVNGTADVATGAGLGVRFTSLVNDPTRFVIVSATTLNAGTIDQTRLQQNSPYMYVVSAGVDNVLNQIYVDARQRTDAEFGFIAAESATYDAFYAALAGDSELLNAFLSQTDRDGFFDMYEQILPEHSGGPLMALATGVDAVTRALSGRGFPARAGETSAWLQEINFYADKDKGEAYGFRSEGFGLAGGIERGTGFGALGVSFALTSSDLEDPESAGEENFSAQLLEFGVYWRAQGTRWQVWSRAAGGYASFDSVRQLVAPGINRRNESSWNGYSIALAGGAAYDYQVGRWSIRPEAIVEYFRLSEDAHEEAGGGAGFDLALDSRDGHIFSSTAAVTIGAGFGENHWLRPELRLGWRQIFSHDPGDTMARFVSGGSPFALAGDSLEGGGPIIGFRLNLGNELGFLAVEADAEMIDDYLRYALLLRASFRF
ncbi:autotransporter domain-containing protein [Brevundimonas sp.]|uniref:autotransporter outer membrane beta-barrel domain-containing protein n=1 Tax=Brevundimonas sp. TaxID=1871086 RepID=UPI0025E89CA3|nr:autotransporter outer membrane beta-barrel domain-containing protein [Brevundimonas sp.]